MEKYILITVDCDTGQQETVDKRRQNLDTLLDIFEACGFAGHITWFLNEHRLKITEHHPSFLHETLRRGDTVGLHDHIDFIENKNSEASIFTFCAQSLDRVTQWLKNNGYSQTITAHRMGCLYQRIEAYRALARLGYSVLSDVYPEFKMPDHAMDESFDNLTIPQAAGPYRHAPDNFLDYTSTSGPFLHFPLFHMFMHNFDFSKLSRWLSIGEREHRPAMFLVWCLHPYELSMGGYSQGWDWEKIDPDKIDKLKTELNRLQREFHLQPANLSFCATLQGDPTCPH